MNRFIKFYGSCREGLQKLRNRTYTAFTGKLVLEDENKNGMEILQVIVVCAVVAIILFVTLPKLNTSLQGTNDNTLEKINNLESIMSD